MTNPNLLLITYLPFFQLKSYRNLLRKATRFGVSRMVARKTFLIEDVEKVIADLEKLQPPKRVDLDRGEVLERMHEALSAAIARGVSTADIQSMVSQKLSLKLKAGEIKSQIATSKKRVPAVKKTGAVEPKPAVSKPVQEPINAQPSHAKSSLNAPVDGPTI